MARRLRLISTALSDIGYVRANNQDSGFAGSRIIAMADGMGGHAGGDTASTIVIRTLAHIERSEPRGSVGAMATRLVKSLLAAHDAITGRAQKEPSLAGMGTTVDAVALTRGWWAQVHIGDSRAYLLRDGHLIRMTKDHSYVQHLIDTGRITPEEGRNHPQKNIVMRVLGDFDIDPHPDVALHKAQPGDRWLLCSDGLCGSLEDETIQEVMLSEPDRAACAQKLVNMALRAGSTDNVTAVIGDAQTAPAARWSLINPNYGVQVPLVAGAAVAGISSIADVVHRPVAQAPHLRSEETPAQKAAELTGRIPAITADKPHPDTVPAEDVKSTTTEIAPGQKVAHPENDKGSASREAIADTGEIPVVRTPDGKLTADPSNAAVRREAERRKEAHERRVAAATRHRRRVLWTWVSAAIATLALLVGGGVGYYAWSQTNFYLGVCDGYVTVYRGVSTNLFGVKLSHPERKTSVPVLSLPASWQSQLGTQGIPVSSVKEGLSRAREISRQSDALQSASPSASSKRTGGGKPAKKAGTASKGGK